ncbi:MAG: acetamidase/formamidase family protein [Verrucomicrobia bacterium]|nr:acetamidase/formamidase family protein [Verrucomicrobiota bacterium]
MPRVEFAGIIHPELIGCLPLKVLFDTWNRREATLFETHPNRVPPLCAWPCADTAHLGKLKGSAESISNRGLKGADLKWFPGTV